MKIQNLSGNYCAFPIQNNRCCLTAQMHKTFSDFEMCFEEHLREYQKVVLTHFLKKSIYDFIELSRRYFWLNYKLFCL
jgi:hypothetical protein